VPYLLSFYDSQKKACRDLASLIVVSVAQHNDSPYPLLNMVMMMDAVHFSAHICKYS